MEKSMSYVTCAWNPGQLWSKSHLQHLLIHWCYASENMLLEIALNYRANNIEL